MAPLPESIIALLRAGRVLPAITLERGEDGPAVAQALVDGGLPIMEIMLRTPAALEAIGRISAEVEGALVGAGTVMTPRQVDDALGAGAMFLVSPGAAPGLLDAVDRAGAPLLPGAATASEAMVLLERGYVAQKFFPAETAGGVAALKALAGPLPQVAFCATGGINAANAGDYLALGNILCVGGSWVAPPDAIAARDWPRITALAGDASGLQTPR